MVESLVAGLGNLRLSRYVDKGITLTKIQEGVPMAKKAVLLVDEDLTRLGLRKAYFFWSKFSVFDFSDPQKALDFFQEYGAENFSLLVASFNMPQMRGDALITKVKEICPDLKTICQVGLFDSVADRACREAGSDYILPNGDIQLQLGQIINNLFGESIQRGEVSHGGTFRM